MDVKNLDKGALKQAIKEILLEEKNLIKEICREIFIDYTLLGTREPLSGKGSRQNQTRLDNSDRIEEILRALT